MFIRRREETKKRISKTEWRRVEKSQKEVSKGSGYIGRELIDEVHSPKDSELPAVAGVS